MNRRALLATVGGSLAALSGCLDTVVPDAVLAEDRPANGTVVDRDDDPPVADNDGCPSFVTAERTDCAGVDPAVALTPSSNVFEEYSADDTVEILELTLENRSESAFEFNPDAWRLHRRTGDGDAWSRVRRDSVGSSLTRLDPGENHVYGLATTAHPTPRDQDRTSVVLDLDSGETYAVLVTGTLDPDGAATTVQCVARFRYLRAVP